MSDLDRLAEFARAATPGPWAWIPSEATWAPAPEDSYDELRASTAERTADNNWAAVIDPWGHDASGAIVSKADAAYIAAVSPDVVLELIERVRAAEDGGS